MRSLPILTTLIILAAPASAETVTASGRIDAVTVYPQGANVVRVLPLEVEAGAHTLVVGGLPLGLATESVSIDGDGVGDLLLGSIEFERLPADPESDPQRVRLTRAILELEDELRAIDDRIAALDLRRRFLDELVAATPAGFSEALAAGKGDLAQWSEAAEALGSAMAAVAVEKRSLEQEKRALARPLAALKREFDRLPPPRDRMAMKIEATVAGAFSGDLRIGYRVPDAGWRPAYDALLRTGDGGNSPDLTIIRRAIVRQVTGEDWTGVALTLSTARALGGTAAPHLEPSLVSLFDDTIVAAKRLRSESEVQLAAPAPEPLADVAENAAGFSPRQQEATVDFGAYRADFIVPGRTSVASGSTTRSVRLTSADREVRLETRAVPRISDEAFLHAVFTTSEGAPLLAGDVALFRDGRFVGRGHLGFTEAETELSLGFGVDDRVEVSRVVLDREVGDRGLLSSQRADARRFRITVANRHANPVDIVVLDRIPFSEDEDVEIRRMDGMTPPTETDVNDRRGVMAWEHRYEAGAERVIDVGYEVRWPADRRVIIYD